MQSLSSSLTADTAFPLTSPEAGSHQPATSRKRKRKRTMAGYQVEQTTTGTGTFPPHQLQPESGAITAIKLRRVTDNSSSIACSSTSVPANPEPMETAPAMSAEAASTLPECLSINLAAASDSRLITGNEHTSAMVQDMPEPMEDVPRTTEINSETSISEFTASQQNELRTHLNNQEIQTVLKNAGILLKTLKDRKIQLARDRGKPHANSLFSNLKNFSIVKDSQTFAGYFARANTFFLAVNNQHITNTSCLTSMLRTKTQIIKFAEESEENIQAIAANPCLKRISSMCHARGIPTAKEVNDFVGLEVFKGEGRTLLPSISSMCNGRGIPTAKEVNDFVGLEVLKGEGRTLLPSISSMRCGKGIPTAKEVNDFVGLEVFKGEGRTLLPSISSMCKGRGIPTAREVNDFVGLEVFKGEGRTLLPSISSMRCGKGIPTAKEVNDFVGLEVFKGEGRTLLPSISSMCKGRGIPTAREVNDFVGLEVFKGEGRTLLPSISSMCNGRGIPTAKEVNDFVGLEVFKGEGQTLLPSISSMCHGRGIPTAREVNDFVGLEVFKGEGRTLLHSISSMRSGKGIPTAREVNDFVGLGVFKGEGRTLLPSISSMRCGKGIPTAREVNDFVGLEVFKGEGRTLLPSISSMCNGRGIPTAREVNDFVGLEVFKGEGRTLLPSISSMCNGRGIPTAREVNDFVGLEVFKGEGRTLLPSISSISSMCHGRGIPTAKEVNEFVGLEVFKGQGRSLLPSISSMCNGRGMPTAKEVNDFVGLEVFKGEGRTLLPSISSMRCGKGIPTAREVNDFVGLEVFKGEGRTLLPSISSMKCSKGIPTAREVNDFVGLEVFKGEGRTLLPSISSMCHGRGIPTAREVNDFVGLEVFKGEGRTLLPSISSMCHGRGIPTAREVNDFVRWLPSDEKKSLLKHSCRIYAGFGLPSEEKLTENENKLRQCLKQQGYSTDIGGDRRDDEDELLESSQMKALALFFSAPAKWNMTIAEFQQYLTAHKSPRNERVAVCSALKSLLPILAIHGGPGIRFWLEMHHKEPGCKESLTKALSIPAPLALTKLALTQLPEPGRQEYLELCRNLKPAPTREQWNALKPLRQQLGQRFECTLSKRIMLEILWQQSAENRSKYADKMDELFKTVPTISQWHRLHRVLGPQKMQQFMDACLDYQATPETAPDVTIQQRLLEGMLLTNHSLPEHIDIPDLCFSNRNRVSTDDKRGVIVEGDYVMSGQIRLWHFITAMLIELEQTEYQFKHQRLTVLPAVGAPVVLENPEFTLTDTGFVIKNWTLEQLTAFFKATEFTEQWYKKSQDKRDLCTIRLETKLAQLKARPKETRKSEHKRTAPLLPPSLIITIINSNKPLKPAVWSSLEHYASSGQLTTRLCKALNPVIQKDNDGVVPEHIKNAVAAKLVQIEATKTPLVTAAPQQRPLASTPTQGNQVSNRSIQGPLFTFDAAMEALDRFPVLGIAELELLEPHRSQMTYIELSTAISKMSYAVDSETRKEWNEASEKRIRDPLGLNDIFEMDFDSLATESELDNNQGWLEELLH